MASGRPSREVREAGFTLVEVLVVLAIVAGLAAIAIPRFQIGDGARLRVAKLSLESDLRLLRSAAIRSGEVQELTAVKGGYVLRPADLRRALPDGADLTIVASSLDPESNTSRIRFYPEGDASGGQLALRKGMLVLKVSVLDRDGSIAHGSSQ